MTGIDMEYYINVKELMDKQLPRPSLKRTVFITGWNEWLPLVVI